MYVDIESMPKCAEHTFFSSSVIAFMYKFKFYVLFSCKTDDMKDYKCFNCQPIIKYQNVQTYE